jgi:uncharacterized protein (DUF2267 family)
VIVVIYTQLIGKIMGGVPIVRAADAELALVTCLETLGYLLPSRLVETLQRELPQQCTPPIALGASFAGRHASETAGALHGEKLERVREVCRILSQCLTPELIREIASALPAELSRAFEGRDACVTRAAG